MITTDRPKRYPTPRKVSGWDVGYTKRELAAGAIPLDHMQAVGSVMEKCDGCSEPFMRGSTMSAVVSNDDDPLGWYCDKCISNWNETEGLGIEAKGAE